MRQPWAWALPELEELEGAEEGHLAAGLRAGCGAQPRAARKLAKVGIQGPAQEQAGAWGSQEKAEVTPRAPGKGPGAECLRQDTGPWVRCSALASASGSPALIKALILGAKVIWVPHSSTMRPAIPPGVREGGRADR